MSCPACSGFCSLCIFKWRRGAVLYMSTLCLCVFRFQGLSENKKTQRLFSKGMLSFWIERTIFHIAAAFNASTYFDFCVKISAFCSYCVRLALTLCLAPHLSCSVYFSWLLVKHTEVAPGLFSASCLLPEVVGLFWLYLVSCQTS